MAKDLQQFQERLERVVYDFLIKIDTRRSEDARGVREKIESSGTEQALE